jgi:carbon monoxide dehydrogenase subunit G
MPARSAYVIEYDRTFVFPVPVAELWARLVQVDRFSSWWSWLREFSVEGNGLEPGTVLHGIVVPPIPYHMRLDVVLDECVPERRITASVHGDLEGTARLTFDGDDAEARAHATWTIEMMQRPMRVAARFAYPLLRWGHDRVVDATVDGFARELVSDNAR